MYESGLSVKGERRAKVAREAAKLLYYHFVQDYKRAKAVACRSLRVNTFPTNLEVATELDHLAERLEGRARRDLLITMRADALQIMDRLAVFHPRLIGSVWRGTARVGSDIDITVYSESPQTLVDLIKEDYELIRTEYSSKTSQGITRRYFHIYILSPSGYEVEMVVRRPEEMYEREKCEIYGDSVVGLTREQLRPLLDTDAAKRYLPNRA